MCNIGLTIFASASDKNGKYYDNISWDDVLEAVEAPNTIKDSKEDCALFKLAKFGTNRTKTGSIRNNDNVEILYGLEGDYDNQELEMEQAAEMLQEAGIKCALYPSPSWNPGLPKWRVIVPFSTPVTTGHEKFRTRMMNRINGVLGGVLAGESWTLSQIYYVGRIKGKAYPPLVSVEGSYVDNLDMLDKGAIAKPTRVRTERNESGVGKGEEAFRFYANSLGHLIQDKDGRRDLLKHYIAGLSKKGHSADEIMALVKAMADKYFDPAFPYDLENYREMVEWFVGKDDGYIDNQVPADYKSRERATNMDIVSHIKYLPDIITKANVFETCVYINDTGRVAMCEEPRRNWAYHDARRTFACSTYTNGEKESSVLDWWVDHPERKTVDTLTFRAGAPRFTTSPNGQQALNMYTPLPVPTMDIRKAEEISELFFDHIKWLWGEQADAFIDWLAHIEQFPNLPVQTAWLHIAENQGLGRNWIAGVLVRMWTRYVAPSLDMSLLLTSGYNGQIAEKVLAIVDEIEEGSSGGKWQHAQKFKSMITAESIEINKKYGASYVQFNTLRWLLFSNHGAALPLDRTDRRMNVCRSTASRRDDEYYINLFRARESQEFIDAVRVVLMSRNLHAYNPNKPPIMSEGKKYAIAFTQTPEEKMLKELIQHWPCDLITPSAMMGAMHPDLDATQIKYKSRSASHIRERNGVHKILDGAVVPKYRDRGKVTLYVLRNLQRYLDMSPTDIYECVLSSNENNLVPGIYEGQKFAEQYGEDFLI